MTPTDLANLKNRCADTSRRILWEKSYNMSNSFRIWPSEDIVDVPTHQLMELIKIAEKYAALINEKHQKECHDRR